MADRLSVIWTTRAVSDLDNIIEYLKMNWSDREIVNFNNKLNKAISLISSRPKIFRSTLRRKNLRRCVLSKQTTIYFQEGESALYIVSLFDNRRKPRPIFEESKVA